MRHGRPVVLLAGFKALAASWRYQVKPLAAAGYRVIVVDLRGHGASDRPESGVDMEVRGQDVHDVLETLDLRDAVLVGGSMGGNTIWSYVRQFGSSRVGAIVIVDQTPKMLNTDDWPHGFYGFDASNIDTYFATAIPDTGKGTPVAKRGMRLVRFLRAMKGVDPKMTPGELALLNDHAKADWRRVIEGADVPVLFVARSRQRVLAVQPRRGRRGSCASGPRRRHPEGRSRGEHGAAEGVQRGDARLPRRGRPGGALTAPTRTAHFCRYRCSGRPVLP